MINIIFQFDPIWDEPYLPHLKGVFNNTICKVMTNGSNPVTVMEVVLRAKQHKATSVAVTNPALLQLLLGSHRKALLDDYAGSVIEKFGVEFLILPPVKQLVTVPYGKFLYNRYISKLINPEKWFQFPEFEWELFEPKNTDSVIDYFSQSTFIACDIETGKEEDRVITCVGFTAVTITASSFSVKTVVFPFDSEYNLAVIYELLSLPQMKVFQNGKYDNAYLLRFGLPGVNWSGDTLNAFHCWYAELPKDLAFISTFLLRKWQFWKDEADTTDIMEYYAYNAKDCFSTAMSWMALIQEAPSYVWDNYAEEFPLVFPCLMTELTGLKRDSVAMEREEKKFEASMADRLKTLQLMTANPAYNPSSSQQTLRLFEVLGSGDIKSTVPAARDKVMDRHPLNKKILKEIELYRKDRKLVSAYLKDGYPKASRHHGRTKSWFNRIFYSLNPHGTDTGRLASRESAFWCGWQIQNIPRDREDVQVKEGIVADEGFYFGEADYAQNEARGTAYLSGDTNLISAVDDETTDFHGRNASNFFGMAYNRIVDSKFDEEAEEWVHKVLDKAVRQLSKNTNHGANYNMGPGVMLDTMGIDNVRRAQRLLQLPENWLLLKVTGFLLLKYAEAYPVVKGAWYEKCVADVMGSRMLIGPTGHVRYCFGNPKHNKHWLNAYVAHPPQSLAAMQLNKAYTNVFRNVALRWPRDFKLGPQIHDSILFQYRKHRIDIPFEVKRNMRVPIEVKDTFGIKRTLVVPVDLKGEAERWSQVKAIRWNKEVEAAAIGWSSR